MRKTFMWVVTVLFVTAIFDSISVEGRLNGNQATIAAAQTKKRMTVPAGTRILIRMVDSIDSTKQKTGYRFTASLETNLQAEDTIVAPRGTKLYGRLAQASSAGRMSGSSELTLELTDIVINGTAYPLLTSTYEVKGKGEGGKTAKKVVGGAGLGALIGGIAGGGKGAAIGAGAGAATGTAVAASKKGQQLQIPSEALLEFRLQQPVSLPVAG
jgi:outer membrane lipoprotein SlyB